MLPDAGDIVWAELDPVSGTEQAGRRPALVLTEAAYHRDSPRAVICPITRRSRNWGFDVPLPAGAQTTGYVLVDQVRAVDRAHRLFDFIETAPPELVDEVRGRLVALLGIAFAD